MAAGEDRNAFGVTLAIPKLLLRPEHALIFLGDRAQPFIDEFLHALPAIGFGGVDVALESVAMLCTA